MPNKKRLIACSLIFTLIIICFSNYKSITYSYSIPSAVRVGIKFEGSVQEGGGTVSSISLYSTDGLIIGFNYSNIFNIISYVNKEVVIKPEVGTWFIQTDKIYTDIVSVNNDISNLAFFNFTFFPAYSIGYTAYYGCFTTEADAINALADIKSKVAFLEFKVVKSSSSTTSCLDTNGNYIFISDLKEGICVQPSNPTLPIRIDKLAKSLYKGSIEAYRLEKNKLTVTNIVGIEDYIKSVTASEIGSSAPYEAIKAQAVAARTYVINNLNKNSSKRFDVANTSQDQVYRGSFYESETVNTAVNETAGKVITYNGNIAEVFYFSSSGGYTEDSGNVFGVKLPYLIAVADPYETDSTYNYTWKVIMSKESIKSKLSQYGVNIGDILDIRAVEYSIAGRVTKLEFVGTTGSKIYSNSNCRTILGLSSQMYSIYKKGNSSDISMAPITKAKGKKVLTTEGYTAVSDQNKIYTMTINGITALSEKAVDVTSDLAENEFLFQGKGWGHGVGLSQNGAMGMANAGFNYLAILVHYFPGTIVQ